MTLEKARAEFVALYLADVAQHPDAYKQSVRSDPRRAALQLIDGLDEREVRRLTADLRAEMRAVAKLAGELPKAQPGPYGSRLGPRMCEHDLDDGDTCKLCGENFSVHLALKGAGLL